jgi:hypothetical protein
MIQTRRMRILKWIYDPTATMHNTRSTHQNVRVDAPISG